MNQIDRQKMDRQKDVKDMHSYLDRFKTFRQVCADQPYTDQEIVMLWHGYVISDTMRAHR
jgi:hypothetical protein